ncbi:LuxR C-terminal-related transcriptional regulator [Nocardia sp. NBC_00508]|uniref:LuxR C-terminal-related transcriptional regulator n=1 Tax=Nocardia sp. NBC_00508 TaxID=2975992 RepID=UPI002E803B2A|nr:LuxR C-terminal-related transcriptional regulator [Nocardia sp. NBC_00508]WUD65177.1 LuxR C-terminal-related transcriptional regulator [Nocardia sp. NBC_00508]
MGDPPRWARQLPSEITSFVGRTDELAEVTRLVRCTRFVTLTGAGGVGKTRLALQAARLIADAFPDGVFFVDFSDITTNELVASTIARRLGLVEDAGRSMIDLVVSYLSSRRILLVLDTCEHLLDTCAEVTAEIVRRTELVHILTTTRQPLGVRGEHLFEVRPLDFPPNPEISVGELERFDAVKLLIDRASAVSPAFEVSNANAPYVAQLCARLDGLPLALELAAVRLRAFTVQQLIDHLDRRFSLFAARGISVPPRQQTLDALIRWTYDLCEPAEQLLWARLSIFPATFDLAAAQAVCADDEFEADKVLELIPSLVDKSVVVPIEYGNAGVRYKLLDTIRAFGALKATGTNTFRDELKRHRDHYMLTAERDTSWMCSSRSDLNSTAQLELPNFRMALAYCLENSDERAAGLKLAASLWIHWRTTGHLAEGRQWFEKFLDVSPAPTSARAKALWASAWLATLQGDFIEADRMLSEAEGIAAEIGDKVASTNATEIRGLGYLLRGDYKKSIALLSLALEGHIASKQWVSRLFCLHRLAQAALGAGEPASARDLAQQCFDGCPEPASWLAINAQWILGISLWRLGETSTALELERRVAVTSYKIQDRLAFSLAIQVISWIATTNGDHDRAALLVGAVERSWREIGAHFAARGYLSSFQRSCAEATMLAIGAKKYESLVRQGVALGDDALLAEIDAAVQFDAAGSERRDTKKILTAREFEIAGLVANGLTNSAIAEKLFISTRTVDAHIQNTFTKLSVNSRAQIAAWFASH